jgi:hypothetical protein
MRRIIVQIATLLLIGPALAAIRLPAASWSFDQCQGPDAILGLLNFVPGVSEKSGR